MLCIVKWSPLTGRIEKYQDFATRKEAEDHRYAVSGNYPDAFIAALVDPIRYYRVENGTLVYDPEPEDPYDIRKITIIERLEEAGKLEAAITALRRNNVLYEKWNAVASISSDDPRTTALLISIGADLDVILAPE